MAYQHKCKTGIFSMKQQYLKLGQQCQMRNVFQQNDNDLDCSVGGSKCLIVFSSLKIAFAFVLQHPNSSDEMIALYLFKHSNTEIHRRGGVESENAVGNAYRDGKGVQQSDAEAFNWYQKAAKHGSPESCVNLAVFLNAGRGCRKDPAAAKGCFIGLSECDEDEFDWEGMYTPRRNFFIPSDCEDSSDEEECDDYDNECDQWNSDSEDTDLEEEYCNDPRFEMAAFFRSFDGPSGSCVNHDPVMHDARLLIPAMKDRHQRGWPSAKIFLETVNKMHEAHELLRQKKYTESFVKIREMDSTWVLGILDMMPFLEAAYNILKTDPNNHAAMYIIILFDPSQENKQKLKFSKRCVQLDSSVPQYHEILAISYAAIDQGNQSVRSLEKGIKLHAKSSMLSLRAVLIKNLIHAKDEVVIEAFQQFLASAPSDYENVPSAYFQMGLLVTKNNPAKAAAFYKRDISLGANCGSFIDSTSVLCGYGG